MYSEDTEEDFNTMDKKQQEALLKKTWLDREKQFYGEEIDTNFEIQEEDEEVSDSGDDDELDRGGGQEEEQEETEATSDKQSEEPSRYQIMKLKHL